MTMISIYTKNVAGLILPQKATPLDAGYDIVATTDPKVVGVKSEKNGDWFKSIDYVEYGTGLHLTPAQTMLFNNTLGYTENKYHLNLRPRSSISSKTNFVLANSVGLIDNGYVDEIFVRFKYILQPEDLRIGDLLGEMYVRPNYSKMYRKGDRIAQILLESSYDLRFDLVENLPTENRGGGFGSTGK